MLRGYTGAMPAPLLRLLLGCTAATSPHDSPAGPLVLAAGSVAGTYDVSAVFDPAPTVGPQSLALAITEDAEPVAGATVTVLPWMPAHDHGVSDASDVRGTDGIYTVTWTWPMSGAWDVTVTVDADEGVDSVVLRVDVE